MQSKYEHIPVLLDEILSGINLHQDGIYIDCTFGRGGHSRAILKQLNEKGALLAFDKDPDACTVENKELLDDPRFTFIRSSFTHLEKTAQALQLSKHVDGVLLDLGVSSPQLDDATRGFSFQHDGALDMRMDNTCGITASEWLNKAPKDEIADVLYKFGDERYSRRIARAIVRSRQQLAITQTLQLAKLVASAIPYKKEKKHPATKTFQAIRIFINHELEELNSVLTQAVNILKKNGRLLVISFHSLEDGIVKRFIRAQAQGEEIPREIPIQHATFKPKLKIIGQPIRCTPNEIKDNPRARSALLRIAECMTT